MIGQTANPHSSRFYTYQGTRIGCMHYRNSLSTIDRHLHFVIVAEACVADEALRTSFLAKTNKTQVVSHYLFSHFTYLQDNSLEKA